jgi:hypothetical protein
MMVIVAILGETGVFYWVGIKATNLSKGNLWKLMLLLSTFTAVASMFIDNVMPSVFDGHISISKFSIISESSSIEEHCRSGIRRKRRDGNYGRAEAFAAVVFLATDCPCCPTLFPAVGISINGVFPCPPDPPPVTKGNTPSHLVALSHSK